jgi:hypothetical protein
VYTRRVSCAELQNDRNGNRFYGRCGNEIAEKAIGFTRITVKHDVSVCYDVHQKIEINILRTKRNLLYIRHQSVPRCKHFPPRL